MKKNPVFVMLLSILIISLMQSCQKSGPETMVSDKEVAIKLKSTMKDGVYHLEMKDSKGQEAIDDLETVFKKKAGESGTIIWKDRFLFSRIKRIDSIYIKETETIIFKQGVTRISKKKFQLELPLDIPQPGDTIEEKYYIDYTSKGNDEVISIDPYIRITD